MTKAKPLPPLELVQQLLDYDPETGVFVWKANRGRKGRFGSVAGSISSLGYLRIMIQGKTFPAHRLAWLVLTSEDPINLEIDHINGSKIDNRACNLRLATRADNMRNMPKSSNNSSGLKGVHFYKPTNKWKAQICCNNRKIALGYFDTPELAHMAYCKAAAELHGEFARAM